MDVLRMLHPFMPFITSELWQALQPDAEQLGRDSWPTSREELRDEAAERDFALLQDASAAIRNLRSEAGLDPRQAVDVHITGQEASTLVAEAALLEALAHASVRPGDPAGPVLEQPLGGAQLRLPLTGLVDLDEWNARQAKRLKALESDVERAERKLSNQGFLQKADPAVVEAERAKLAGNRELLERLRAMLQA